MLLHVDGFDSYAVATDLYQEYSIVGLGQFSTTSGRFGGGAFYISGNYNYIGWSTLSPLTNIWTGFAFSINPSDAGTGVITAFQSGTGDEATVYYNVTTGQWNFYRGYTNTSLGSVVYPISLGIYHWIEIHYVISTTVGIMELWIDGIQVLAISGANTTQNGLTSFTSVVLGDSGATARGYYDDWYILDTTGTYNNTRLGDSRVETLRPQSDFGPNNGVPSTAGPHYKMINELQWNSSNTITLGSTSGNAEVFGMTSLTAAPTNIHAVRVLATAEKTDAGALSTNAIVVSSNVTANGNSIPLTTSYSHIYNVFETDPNTGVPWTTSAINNIDCGVKIP